MVKLFKRTVAIFTKTQTNILSAASVIMIAVFVSRILGLLRDRMLASQFSPHDLGVYYAAFRLPNMIFELLVMGALATAFIPVFTTYAETKGKEQAFRMASSLINVGLILFTLLCIPMVIFARQLSTLLAPGFDDVQISQMASFTRIMLIAQVLPLIVGNFFTGMLQSFRNFLIPSLAPILYNIGIIAGIVFLTPSFGLYAPVLGVVFGAILFTLVQIPAIWASGYRHKVILELSHPGVSEVGKLMLPRTIGLAVSQIDTTIDLVLSTLLGAGAVTVFNFAQHLQQLPVGLFGASIAQASLPTLSSMYATKNRQEFARILLSSFHQILFLVVPFSAILIVLRIPMVRLVFGASSLFDWASTVATGQTLAYFAISLFAQSLVHLFARSFFAMHESKIPVLIGAVCVGINTILSLFFILSLKGQVWSLGLSASIASICNMVLLLYFLDRRIGPLDRYELLIPTLKILLSGFLSGIALYIPIKLLDQLVFDTTRTFNLLILTGISAIAGLSVYFFFAWFLEVSQVSVIRKLFGKARLLGKGVVIDTSQEVIDESKTNVA